MAAARRSTGGSVPRNSEPTATISVKCLSARTDTVAMLSSPSEHGPGHSLCPHTRGRDHSPERVVIILGEITVAYLCLVFGLLLGAGIHG
jgi:hypothetical protein